VAAQHKGSEAPSYLLAAEVADILHVSPKTVSRWAKEGKLPFMKTLGGHRRYPRPRSGSSSTPCGRSQPPELAESLGRGSARCRRGGRQGRLEPGEAAGMLAATIPAALADQTR
jgi:excisionase family DNA binding protein